MEDTLIKPTRECFNSIARENYEIYQELRRDNEALATLDKMYKEFKTHTFKILKYTLTH
jgi:hypothetical protein